MQRGWRNTLEDNIKPNSPLMTKAPAGITKICPRFTALNTRDKTQVWANLLESMAQAESGF
jgi:hypothetical protein